MCAKAMKVWMIEDYVCWVIMNESNISIIIPGTSEREAEIRESYENPLQLQNPTSANMDKEES